MAGRVYSTRFVNAVVQSVASASAAGWTSPANKVTVVRTIDLFVSTPGVAFVGYEHPSALMPLVSAADVPQYHVQHWEGDQVFEPDQRIRCQWLSGVYTVVISGFLLDV